MNDSAVTIATGNIPVNYGTVTIGGTHIVTHYVTKYVIPSTKVNIPKKDDAICIEEIAGCFKRLYFDEKFWKRNHSSYLYSGTFDDLYIPMTLQTYSIDGSCLKERNLPLEDLLNSKYGISKKILLTGEPGSGRTTACRKLIHHWMNKDSVFLKDIQLAIYLRLDEVHANETIVDIILERCQCAESNDIDTLELLSKLNERLLVILDGFDNATEGVKNSALKLLDYKHLAREYHFRNANIVLTTSLPQAKCVYQHFNDRAHIAGLTLENQLQYVKKYAIEDEEKHTDLIESQQEWLHLSSPLFLQMLFYLLRAKKEFSDSTQFWKQFFQEQEGNATLEGTIPEICLRNLTNNQNSIPLADFTSGIPEGNNFLLTSGIFHIVTSEGGVKVVQPVHKSVMQFLATSLLQSKWNQMENEELRKSMLTELKIEFSNNHRECIDLFESKTEVVMIIELIANAISLILKISRDEKGVLLSRSSYFLATDAANKQVKKLCETSKYSTRMRLCPENAFNSECMNNIGQNPLIYNGIEYLSLITDWKERKLLFRMHSNIRHVLDIPVSLFKNLQISDEIQYCGIDVACQNCNLLRSQGMNKGVGENCMVTDIFQKNRLCTSSLDNPKETFSYMLTKSSCSNSFFGVFIALMNLQKLTEFFCNMQMYFAFVNWQAALNGLKLPVEISFADTNSEKQIEFLEQRQCLLENSDSLIERALVFIRYLGEVLKLEGDTIIRFLLKFKVQLEKFIKQVNAIPNYDNPISAGRCIDELNLKVEDLSKLYDKRGCGSKNYDFHITKELPAYENELNQMKTTSRAKIKSITMNFLDRNTFADSITAMDAHFQFEMDALASNISTIENSLKISRIEGESDKDIVASISNVLKKFNGHTTDQTDNGLKSGLSRDLTMLYKELKSFDRIYCKVDQMFEMENKRWSAIKNSIDTEINYQHDILDNLKQEVKEVVTIKDIRFQAKQTEITEMVEHMFETNCNSLRNENDGNQDLPQSENEPSQDLHSFGLVITESGVITCHSPTKTFALNRGADNEHDVCEELAMLSI